MAVGMFILKSKKPDRSQLYIFPNKQYQGRAEQWIKSRKYNSPNKKGEQSAQNKEKENTYKQNLTWKVIQWKTVRKSR